MSMSGRKWLILIAGLIIVVPVAKFAGRTLAEAQNQRDADIRGPINDADEPDVIAIVTRQDSEGVTEGDFSTEFLKNLEDWILQRTVANSLKHWDAAGVPENKRNVTAESVFVNAGPHKLAVVRMQIGETTPNATITGVVGSEVVRVLCIDKNGGDVPIASGPCDTKIQEAFGSSVNPMRT